MELSIATQVALRIASSEARRCRNRRVEPEHLFIGLCKLVDIDRVLNVPVDERSDITWLRDLIASADLRSSALRKQLRSVLRSPDELSDRFDGHRSPRCVDVLRAAEELAGEEDRSIVGVRDLFTVLVVEAGTRVRQAISCLGGRWSAMREGAGLVSSIDR